MFGIAPRYDQSVTPQPTSLPTRQLSSRVLFKPNWSPESKLGKQASFSFRKKSALNLGGLAKLDLGTQADKDLREAAETKG